jgi:predicted ester cyclase
MVIPTIAALAIRHFKQSTPEAQHEPKHAAVKFLLAAWNNGDFSEAGEQVAPDCTIRMNGFTYDPDTDVDGPTMARQSIEYWRAMVPDIKMELIQEIKEKDHIALEWFLTGTHTGERVDLPASGNALELPGSAFLTLEKGKIVEVATAFDALTLAVQTGSIEPPEWWPGRQAS